MGERLGKPPLIEAICEFRFSEQDAWDWTLAGRLFERIQDEFPLRSQLQSFGVQLEHAASRPPISTLQPGPDRIQLKRRDGSALIQVGPHLLTVNHLKPYASWENYLGLVMQIWDHYHALAPGAMLERIGLRYINHLPISDNRRLEDYLTVAPPLMASLQVPLLTFYQRYELVEDQPVGSLIHQTGNQTLSGDSTVIVLDLDFFSLEVRQLRDGPAITRWLNAAHDRVYTAFVDSLTPRLYDQLRSGAR